MLVDIHPDPFIGGSEAAFRARIDDLAGRADTLTEDEFRVEAMRLLANRDRDGHTGIVPFAQSDDLVHAWPIALYAFEEGMYVVDAMPPHRQLIGLRLVRIEGRPLREVERLVRPLVTRDNAWSLRARLPAYLVVPEVLAGLGLLRTGAPALTFEGPNGTTLGVTPEPIPVSAYRAWRRMFDPLVPPSLPPDDDGPVYLRNRAEFFWSRIVDDAVYVGYNQVQATSPSGVSLSDLIDRIRRQLERAHGDRIVVDLRHNPGGNNGTYAPLRYMLERRARAIPGSVVLLVGRSTFSAAANFVTETSAARGVATVGEPTGGAPNQFGDPTRVVLPASGLVVSLATWGWEFAPGDDSLTIEPDVRVPVSWADFAAGRDPALEAALR